jgi:hypothetical protein
MRRDNAYQDLKFLRHCVWRWLVFSVGCCGLMEICRRFRATAPITSETSANFYQTAWHIPEDSRFQGYS